jgi:hypothetical protein
MRRMSRCQSEVAWWYVRLCAKKPKGWIRKDGQGSGD